MTFTTQIVPLLDPLPLLIEQVALNYTDSVPLLGRILPLPLRPKRVLCMCSPLGGLGGGIEVSRFKKRAVSAKVQTLNSTLWITQETLLTRVSSNWNTA